MTYEETLEFLYQRHTSTYRGLTRIRYLLEQLGNPQERFPSVLITGTNGKGSVAKMLNSVFIEAGYRVGCFTSPHLLEFGERMTLNGLSIPRETVVELVEQIQEGPMQRLELERETLQIEGAVSFFEIVTAMAFLYFAQNQVEMAILEVGIGGRLDATNTANPLVSIITNVDLDHQRFLGNSVVEIAGEKSAIIREGGELVTGCRKPEALAVIQNVCRQKQAAFYQTGLACEGRQRLASETISQKTLSEGSVFSYHGLFHQWNDLFLSLAGEHQLGNAAVALTTLELLEKKGFSVSESALRAGLRQVRHPGRLELLRREPCVVVDIAHNQMGAEAIAKTLMTIFPHRRLILVIGVLHDKDVKGILQPLLHVADALIFTGPHTTQRAETASATAKVAEELIGSEGKRAYEQWRIVEYVDEAIRQAGAFAGKDDVICVTGSNYTVSEAERYLAQKGTLYSVTEQK